MGDPILVVNAYDYFVLVDDESGNESFCRETMTRSHFFLKAEEFRKFFFLFLRVCKA